MNFFNFDLRKIITLAVLAALPVLSVNLQKDSQDGPWIFRPFYIASSFTQSLYGDFSSGVRSTTDLYLNLIDIKKTNRELVEELNSLKAQLGDLTELRLENERLNELLDFKRKTDMELLAAKITGRDLFPDSDTLTINRGLQNGVTKGMAVITPSGAVGYVVQAEDSTSQVLLLTHRYAVIDAVVQSSRARGIVHGYNSDLCELRYLNRNDQVKKGDLIVTSGLDNIFPKGLPVGVVTEVHKDDFKFEQEVYLAPVVAASKLEEVFVVLNANRVDLSPPPEPQPTEGVETEAGAPTPAKTEVKSQTEEPKG